MPPKRRTKDFQKSKLSGQVSAAYTVFMKRHKRGPKQKWTSHDCGALAFGRDGEIIEPYAGDV